jgi:hypothetical protein
LEEEWAGDIPGVVADGTAEAGDRGAWAFPMGKMGEPDKTGEFECAGDGDAVE